MFAYPCLIASYVVPVRQYRSLPVGFLHCCCYQQPACHLLTVRGVTPVRKGLTPYGIFSYFTYCLTPKICIFNIFSELLQKCAHAHAGHTQIVNCIAGFVRCRSLDSRFAVPSYRTGTLFEIRNDKLQVTVKHLNSKSAY